MNIQIVTSDSVIWDREKVVFDLINAAQHGPVILHLLYEGPDCIEAGIDKVLDQVSALLQLPRTHFLINTSNQLASSAYPEQRSKFVELDLAKQLATSVAPINSTLQHRFGMFIGRSNWQRLGIAAYLHTKYRSLASMTFHYNPELDYHRSNFGLEEFVQRNWDHREYVYEFLKHVPITHDEQSYPILWKTHGFGLTEQYKNIFVEIVCETFFSGRTFFITEKTLRCIINRRPFLVQGPKHYLKNLQLLGFKTFDNWWSESYDSDHADARYLTFCNQIDWIATQSSHTIEQWYKEMQPTLEHNIQCLQQLTTEKILTTEFIA